MFDNNGPFHDSNMLNSPARVDLFLNEGHYVCVQKFFLQRR